MPDPFLDAVPQTFGDPFLDAPRQWMEHARRSAASEITEAPGLTETVRQESAPFFSQVAGFVEERQYGAARRRVEEGTAAPQDYHTVARRERTREVESQAGFGHQAARTLAGGAALVGEIAATGGAGAAARLPGLFSRAGLAAAGRAAVSPSAYGRLLARTVPVPSFYAADWAQRATEGGRDPVSVESLLRDAPPAVVHGMLLNAVFGSLGQAGNSVTGRGVLPVARRLIARSSQGLVEQEGANLLAGGVAEALGDTHGREGRFGFVGRASRGEWGEAWRQLALDSIAMAAFSGYHELREGDPGPHLREQRAHEARQRTLGYLDTEFGRAAEGLSPGRMPDPALAQAARERIAQGMRGTLEAAGQAPPPPSGERGPEPQPPPAPPAAPGARERARREALTQLQTRAEQILSPPDPNNPRGGTNVETRTTTTPTPVAPEARPEATGEGPGRPPEASPVERSGAVTPEHPVQAAARRMREAEASMTDVNARYEEMLRATRPRGEEAVRQREQALDALRTQAQEAQQARDRARTDLASLSRAGRPVAPPEPPGRTETAPEPAAGPEPSPQAPEAAAGQAADPVERAGRAFGEVFPEAQPSGGREGVLRAESRGRWVELAEGQSPDSVRLDFGWLGERTGRERRPGDQPIVGELGQLVRRLKESGTNVEYVAVGGRERGYAALLRRAGYEQVSGPSGEGGELRVWRPREAAPEATQPSPLVERMRQRAQGREVPTPTVQPSEAEVDRLRRQAQTGRRVEPEQFLAAKGLTPQEQQLTVRISNGESLEKARKAMGLNSRQHAHQIAARAAAKLGLEVSLVEHFQGGEGALLRPGNEPPSAEDVEVARHHAHTPLDQLERQTRAVKQLADQLEAEAARGPLSEERRVYYASEGRRLAGLPAENPAGTPAAGSPAPVRREGVPPGRPEHPETPPPGEGGPAGGRAQAPQGPAEVSGAAGVEPAGAAPAAARGGEAAGDVVERRRLEGLRNRFARQRDETRQELESAFPSGRPPDPHARGYDDRARILADYEQKVRQVEGQLAALAPEATAPETALPPSVLEHARNLHRRGDGLAWEQFLGDLEAVTDKDTAKSLRASLGRFTETTRGRSERGHNRQFAADLRRHELAQEIQRHEAARAEAADGPEAAEMVRQGAEDRLGAGEPAPEHPRPGDEAAGPLFGGERRVGQGSLYGEEGGYPGELPQPKLTLAGEQRALDERRARAGSAKPPGSEGLAPEDWFGEPGGFGRPVTPGEGALPGGGQPQAGEVRQPPTALANEVMEAERRRAGRDQLAAAARLANPTVWDQALQNVRNDPDVAARLVERLTRNPNSATTVQENALLLQRKVALRNEYERTVLDYLRAGREGADAVTVTALENREAELSGQIDRLDRVTRATGTEWGRAGQFRRQMAEMDYSLGALLLKARGAYGRPLAPPEIAEVTRIATRVQTAEGELRAAEEGTGGLAGAGPEGETPRQLATRVADSPEVRALTRARTESGGAQGEADRFLEAGRRAKRPFVEKALDLLVRLRRAFLLSNPITVAKLSAAGAERMISTPLEEGVGAVLSRLPGLSRIAALAPREGRGLNPAAEAKALGRGLYQGVIDAFQTLREGRSALEKEQGVPVRSVTRLERALDLPGLIHAALKAPVKRNEYTRSYLQRMEDGARNGRDVTSPAALAEIAALSYQDANRAIFQGDNRVVDAWKRGISWLKRPEASFGSRALGTIGELAVPIVRVPTNIVAETFQYAFGSVTGSVGAARALSRGVEMLKPAEADLIMRQLKKGSLGLAVMALGYFVPGLAGGFYSGRRQPGDEEAGSVAGAPPFLVHHPLLEAMQIGASTRRVQNQTRRPGGAAEGVLEGARGLVREVPFVRSAEEVGRMVSTDPRERGRAFGQLAKSFAVPQFFQWLSGRLDTETGTPLGPQVRRQARTLLEHVQSGVPGWRSQLPARR